MDETTPLLVEAHDQEKQLLEEAAAYRGQSPVRWQVLIGVFFSWAADCALLFAPSALEDTLLGQQGWSSAQFSAIVSVATFIAIPGAIAAPPLVQRFGAFQLIFVGNMVTAASQVLLSFGVAWHSYAVVLGCRVVFGFFYGLHTTILKTIATFWFSAHEVGFALSTLTLGLTSGILLTRYAVPPLGAAVGASSALLMVAALPVLAVVGLGVSLWVERRFLNDERVPQFVRERSTMTLQRAALRDIGRIDRRTWLTIAAIVCTITLVMAYDSLFVEALVQLYGVNEQDANLIVSIFVAVGAVTGSPLSWFMGKVGGYSWWLLLCAGGFLGGAALFAVHAPAGVAMAVLTVGPVLMGVVYSILGAYTVRGTEVLVAAVYTTIKLVFFSAVAQLFGVLADVTHTYASSILLVLGVSAALVAVSVAIVANDFVTGGALHVVGWRTKKRGDEAEDAGAVTGEGEDTLGEIVSTEAAYQEQ